MPALIRLVTLAMCFAFAGSAWAQTYPERPIRLVVGYAAGGGLDALARTLADKLAGLLGVETSVENRPGAGGAIAAAHVKKAPADGYTLFFADTGMIIGPTLNPSAAYDPVKDFVPVARIGASQLALAAHPSAPANDLPALLALLKSKPGEFSYATPGIGTPHHLAGVALQKAAGVSMVHVPYKGGGPALADLMGGMIPLSVVSVAATLPQHKSGRVKILALLGPERFKTLPDLPVVAETVPGFASSAPSFLLAPSGTPAEAVEIVRKAVLTALADPGLIEAFTKFGTTVPSPEDDFDATWPQEVEAWTQIARGSGAKSE